MTGREKGKTDDWCIKDRQPVLVPSNAARPSVSVKGKKQGVREKGVAGAKNLQHMKHGQKQKRVM
jgi:hypothetical protein